MAEREDIFKKKKKNRLRDGGREMLISVAAENKHYFHKVISEPELTS